MGKLLGVREMKIASYAVVHCEVKTDCGRAIHVLTIPGSPLTCRITLNRFIDNSVLRPRTTAFGNLVRSVDWERRWRFATAIRMKDDVKREKGRVTRPCCASRSVPKRSSTFRCVFLRML